MSLSNHIERLNEQADEILVLMRENARLRQEERRREEIKGTRSDVMPAAPFFFVAGFRALRNSLVPLPDAYFEREEDGVLIACRCRRGARVPVYSFHGCTCGRVFCVTHRSVKVLPLEEQALAA